MASHKKFLGELVASNHSITVEINQLATQTDTKSQDELCADIKNLLLKIYDSIVLIGEHRGHPRTPNKAILDTYRSFFEPIQALSKLPSGDFLTARMLLYLTDAISNETALAKKFIKSKARLTTSALHEFTISLDDAVLEPLRRIWTASDKSENYDWIFGNYTIQSWRFGEHSETQKARNRELAKVLTPEELMSLGGITKRHFLFCEPGGKQDWQLFSDATRDLYPMNRSFAWREMDTDGPIRAQLSFRLVDDSQNDEESWRSIDVLRRSRQFILDAQRIAQPILAKKRRYLAKLALIEARLPPEIQLQILGYLEQPLPHLYLSSVDIAAAYTAFPEVTEKCSQCKARNRSGANGRLKFTCPADSLHVWNLSLRAFHIFHQCSRTEWRLCRFGIECQGHHEDNGWEVNNEHQLLALMETLASDRHGTRTTLDDIGLGQEPNLRASSREEDWERQARLFPQWPPYEDLRKEAEINGGVGGLIDSMLHQRMLVSVWTSGHGISDAHWAWGRNLMEKKRGEDAISSIHQFCNFC